MLYFSFIFIIYYTKSLCINKKSPTNIKPPIIDARGYEFNVDFINVKKIILSKTSWNTYEI